jgi:hypothetical protein
VAQRHTTSTSVLRLVAIAVACAVLTACGARTTAPPPAEGSADRLFPVTLQRTGGFAGVDQTVEIAADGTVSAVVDGETVAGLRLDADELDRVGALAAEVVAADLPETPDDPPMVADGYQYDLGVGDRQWTAYDGALAPEIEAFVAELEPLLPPG